MTSPDRTAIRVSRRFTASAECVYDAWLDVKTAKRWLFATASGQIVRADVDPRVGGTFTLVDRRAEGDVEHVGTYLELDRPRRIVFTFVVPKYSSESTRIQVDIVPVGSGSELTLTQEGVLPEYRERTEKGWTTLLGGLAGALD